MIISASRRTDIPAFYSDWLWKRLKDGVVRVRNPFRPSQIRSVSLKPEEVTAFVFWTKNPQTMIPHLNRLNDYAYYFLFTLTAYGKALELRVPLESDVLRIFRSLSERIGSQRLIWRYDPIILTNELTPDEHCRRFERLAAALASFTTICVISFLSFYRKCQNNLRSFALIHPDETAKAYLADRFSGMIDVLGCHVVTVGAQASDFSAKLFDNNQYSDYLYFHGLSVETAEALAEHWHKEMRCQLGIDQDDSADIRKLFQQHYQGSRYSFGYPACPHLEDQKKLFELLQPENIGVVLSEGFQLHPEQSTSAIIVHHPQAKYFNVR